jgi:hypothetical protein
VVHLRAAAHTRRLRGQRAGEGALPVLKALNSFSVLKLDKVPELVGYWFFTLLPQLPINIYFLLLPQQGTPLDRALAIIMLAAHVLGLARAWFVIRQLVRHQQLQLKFEQASRQQTARNVALA